MKILRFSCKALSFLLLASALVCVLCPVHAFALDERRSVELARQKEQIGALTKYTELSIEAALLDGYVSKISSLLYEFTFTGEMQTVHEVRAIETDIESCLRRMLKLTKGDSYFQSSLSDFDKFFTNYKTNFSTLANLHDSFFKQHDNMVAPLFGQLQGATETLAKIAAGLNNTELSELAIDCMFSFSTSRIATVDFFYTWNPDCSEQAMYSLRVYSENLQNIKTAAVPEVEVTIKEISDVLYRLQGAVKLLDEAGYIMLTRSDEAEENLNRMKKISGELANAMLRIQHEVSQEVDRNMQF